jgi:hypothetical protein
MGVEIGVGVEVRLELVVLPVGEPRQSGAMWWANPSAGTSGWEK